jgi:hypothetical protein
VGDHEYQAGYLAPASITVFSTGDSRQQSA